jgi:hypothetical protein
MAIDVTIQEIWRASYFDSPFLTKAKKNTYPELIQKSPSAL